MMRRPNQWLPALVPACLLCLLFSCHKEYVSGLATPADSTALFSASIDGTPWQTDSIIAVVVNQFPGYSKELTITAYTSTRAMAIAFRDTSYVTTSDSIMATGTYAYGSPGQAAAFSYAANPILVGRDSVWQQQGTGIAGQAVITASDGVHRLLSGSFSFTARAANINPYGTLMIDTVSVMSGMFRNVPYTYFRHP